MEVYWIAEGRPEGFFGGKQEKIAKKSKKINMMTCNGRNPWYLNHLSRLFRCESICKTPFRRLHRFLFIKRKKIEQF